jgi:protein SCO1/2
MIAGKHAPRRAFGLAAALIASAAAGAATWAHETAALPPAQQSAAPFLGVIRAAPDFTLNDTGGRPVRLAHDRGRVVLIAFIYTSCTTACPLLSLKMSLLQRELLARGIDGRQVRFYSITVDPERDSADALARYARPFVRDGDAWRFLHASPARLREVLAAWDEWTRPLPDGELDHPARLHLVDPRGRIREIYSLAFFDERQALVDITTLLDGQ